jgi:hypothetical protein
VFRLMTPHDALKVALEAEQRARAYFEQVFANATDPDVKMLAAAMIQEEQQHIEWVERALATDPDPHLDWDKLFAHRRAVLPPGPGVESPSVRCRRPGESRENRPEKEGRRKQARTEADGGSEENPQAGVETQADGQDSSQARGEKEGLPSQVGRRTAEQTRPRVWCTIARYKSAAPRQRSRAGPGGDGWTGTTS